MFINIINIYQCLSIFINVYQIVDIYRYFIITESRMLQLICRRLIILMTYIAINLILLLNVACPKCNDPRF